MVTQVQALRMRIPGHVNSHRSLEMPHLAECDGDALWVVYPDCIIADLGCDEIIPGSLITISPEQSITIDFGKPLGGEMNSPCGYIPIFVSFDQGWTFATARAWWAAFVVKMQQGSWEIA